MAFLLRTDAVFQNRNLAHYGAILKRLVLGEYECRSGHIRP
jgi:hypothetical protein